MADPEKKADTTAPLDLKDIEKSDTKLTTDDKSKDDTKKEDTSEKVQLNSINLEDMKLDAHVDDKSKEKDTKSEVGLDDKSKEIEGSVPLSPGKVRVSSSKTAWRI